MSGHARFAPSGAHRWIACPGSIRLSENIESRTSVYAMAGTVQHKVAEQCLREKIPATQFIGMTLDSPKDDPDWSMEFEDEHAEAVQYCVDEVKRITSELGVQGGRLELRVELNEDCWGTVDVLLWNEEYLVDIDFKFGQTPVEAEGNPQLMIYTLGAAKYLHEQGIAVPPKAKLVILQPYIPKPTKVWDTTVHEIKEWYVKSVKPAIEEAKNGNAVCNPGESQCKFCDANGVCTARANYLLGVAEDEFKPFVVGDSDVPAVPDVKPLANDILGKMDMAVDMLTPEIAGKILAYQPDFDNFFKKIGEYALQAALDGKDVTGFKVVYGRSNRKWVDEAKAEAFLKKELKDDAFNKKLLSPAQAEKKLGKKRKGDLAEFIHKPVGKKILVDEADTREPVDLTGEADMAEFADESATGSSQEDVAIFESTDTVDDIMAGFEEEEKKEPEGTEELLKGSNASPPKKTTKKFKLMEMGLKGGIPIQDAADELFKGDVSQVKKGLRNLNERDGYTILFHADQTFTVKE